jgi:long-chain acyl-CoA synthetase
MTEPAAIALPRSPVADVAIRFGASVISYPALGRRIARAGQALRAMGVTKGRAFAVIGENAPEILIAYQAAARVGAVFISVNAGLKPAEVSYILDHAECVVLLHDEATAALAAEAAPPQRRRPLADLDVASMGAAEPVAPDGDFMIAYTSGTTGVPKAVVFDQACEVAGNQALIDLWGVTHKDRIAVALPLGFLYGLSTASAMGLQAGAEIVLLPRFHPQLVLDAFVEYRITVFHGVPTMFAMMLDYCEQNGLFVDLSFMRLLVCAGAPLSPALKQRFRERFGKAVDDYYALTEIRPVFGRYADGASVPSGAIGKAAPGAVIRIVDEVGCDVEEGESGEMWVRAASTMLRYHKDPELTAHSFRDGLFMTGDVGRRDAEGQYFITGRIKDIIICGGANISPAEVENALVSHDGIRAAAVVGRHDPKFGERPVAFVVRADGVAHDDESVLTHCRALLANFKVPVALIDMPDLPLGATGKVDKLALKAILETDG